MEEVVFPSAPGSGPSSCCLNEGPLRTASPALLPRDTPSLAPSDLQRSLEGPAIPCGFPTPRPHFSNESFIKLCSNYPILRVPSASCWDPD